MKLPPEPEISAFVARCLNEDVGDGDLTAGLLPEEARIRGNIIARASGVICGRAWVNEVFLQLDAGIELDWHVEDGDAVSSDQAICDISGPARGILTGERTALNILQTLSGTASVTRRYVDLVSHTDVRILDTRKTIPGMRNAQKYAVTCGGGHNHRAGLYDGILIKENHLRSGKDLSQFVGQALASAPGGGLVELEVENLGELELALSSGINRILLDNFSMEDLAEAVSIAGGKVELEASGDINDANIVEVAETGVNFISLGTLTKNVSVLDLSLLFEMH